jgi:hypothetical protein
LKIWQQASLAKFAALRQDSIGVGIVERRLKSRRLWQ